MIRLCIGLSILLWGILILFMPFFSPAWGVSAQMARELQRQAELEGISPEIIQKGREMLEQESAQSSGKKKATSEPSGKEQKKQKAVAAEAPKPQEKLPEPQADQQPVTVEAQLRRFGLPPQFSESPFFQFANSQPGMMAEDEPPLYPYGYRFFFGKTPPEQPSLALVPENYTLGPGDVLEVLVWGKQNATYTLRIEEDGVVMFPRIGPIALSGLTYGEAKDALRQLVSEKILGARAHVTLSELRSFAVTLVGEVSEPGMVQIPPITTLSSVLSRAGGPLPTGTLRKIHLSRQNGSHVVFDFYRFLDGTQTDYLLRNGDILRVPLIGPQVAVAGQVKRPRIYELADERTLADVIELAGGIIPQADEQRVQIRRLEDYRYREILDINLKQMPRHRSFPIRDWDIITVHKVSPRYENAVTLQGNVLQPGIYEWTEGMRVSDLIEGPDDLKKDTYMAYALIKRRTPPAWQEELVPFHLGRAVIEKSPESNVRLRPMDRVTVFSRWMFEPRYQVAVTGEVQKPGKVDWVKDMTVKDAVLDAGGPSRNAYFEKAELMRRKDSGKWIRFSFDLEAAMKGDAEEDLSLLPDDQIIIHNIQEMVPYREVSIRGAVYRPGNYILSEEMRISDLVFAAGGVKPEAYVDDAELVRKEIQDGQIVRTISENIDLELALKGDARQDVRLQPLDDLYIRPIPDYGEELHVTLTGEFKFPGIYAIENGERLSSLIQRAGGFTAKAYLPGGVFQRERVREQNDRILQNLIRRMESDLARAEMDPAVLMERDKEYIGASLVFKRQALERLREVEIPGRVIVKLEPLPQFAGGRYDLLLENGDSLHVPRRPESVSVVGQVFNPTAVLWQENLTFEDYLAMSGGPTKSADEGAIYIVKTNGMVLANQSGLLNHLSDQPLSPGDTIVVPEQIETFFWEKLKDATQVVYQLAVAIAAVSFIF